MLTLPVSILLIHFLGDFVAQSDWMALNKSKHWDPLVIHGLTYTLAFWLCGFSWAFLGVTFVTHTLTDAVTSRATSKLWFIDLQEPVDSPPLLHPTFEFARVFPRKRHWFFVMIGFDQLVHYTTLALTLKYLGG